MLVGGGRKITCLSNKEFPSPTRPLDLLRLWKIDFNAIHFAQQLVNFSEPDCTSVLLKQVKHRWHHHLFLPKILEIERCTISQLGINTGSAPTPPLPPQKKTTKIQIPVPTEDIYIQGWKYSFQEDNHDKQKLTRFVVYFHWKWLKLNLIQAKKDSRYRIYSFSYGLDVNEKRLQLLPTQDKDSEFLDYWTSKLGTHQHTTAGKEIIKRINSEIIIFRLPKWACWKSHCCNNGSELSINSSPEHYAGEFTLCSGVIVV